MKFDEMKELLDIVPAINVLESEYKRLLGYPPDYELHDQVRDLMDTTIRWYAENGKPWMYARQAEKFEIVEGGLRIDETEIISKRMHNQLVEAHAQNVIFVAVSAGKNLEEKARELWKEEKPDEYFFMEVYGSAVVEHLVTTAGARLCAWGDEHKIAILPHYSPGYPGWNISDQSTLWNLLRRKRKLDFPEEIQVLQSGMLQPKKSLLGIFGMTSHLEKVERLATLVPCKNCVMESCQFRRVPYRQPRPQIEDVRRLQSRRGDDLELKSNSDLNPSAKYSISLRALQKWSRERLRLRILDDRSVRAQFRYEGTTCSNMGRTLEFDYDVTLGPPEQGYTIVDTRCGPAPGDTGHTFMCQYLEAADPLMSAIANHKPLLGKPLKDVLNWKREYTPSGCYCSSASREYKWGIVFEVIHYALVHDENQTTESGREEKITAR